MKILTTLKKPDLGLLIIRIVLGVTFTIYGIQKLFGGVGTLEYLGSTLKIFGITVFPLFFGVLAAVGEAIGGLLLLIGYQFRLAALLLFFIMIVAFFSQYESLASFLKNGWSLHLMAVFLGLAFIGSGKYSLDKDS